MISAWWILPLLMVGAFIGVVIVGFTNMNGDK